VTARSHYVGRWRVDLDRRAARRLVPDTRLARVVAAALEVAGAPRPASMGLILTDDAALAELNTAHFGVTGPTDVLSFPLLPPSAFPPHSGRAAEVVPDASAVRDVPRFALPPGRRPYLGDVVVSVERAIAQADAGHGGQTGDVAWSPADELRLLVVHGVLHVCGWDHSDPAERDAMRALERRLLGQ